jgi:hypothetical protein
MARLDHQIRTESLRRFNNEIGLLADLGGPTMFAPIGVMQALNRHHVREFNTDRKPHHWGKATPSGSFFSNHVSAASAFWFGFEHLSKCAFFFYDLCAAIFGPIVLS